MRHGSVFDSKGNAKVVSEVKVEVDKKANKAKVEVEEKEIDNYDIDLDQLTNKKESNTFNQTVQDQINQLLTMAEEAKERADQAELEAESLKAQNHELRNQFKRQRDMYQTRENQSMQSQGRMQVHDKGSHKEKRPRDLQCARRPENFEVAKFQDDSNLLDTSVGSNGEPPKADPPGGTGGE